MIPIESTLVTSSYVNVPPIDRFPLTVAFPVTSRPALQSKLPLKNACLSSASTENNIEDKQAKAAEPEDSTTDEKDANSTEESESGPEVEEPNSESTNGVAEPDTAGPNSELDESEGEEIETQNPARWNLIKT